ncbi:hypothetical protein [Pseudomonas putida]|uniref:hypothetical protein n=1 Tax=Pseudomonas putida TaxID=303 RepID=UPI00155740F5|nr:hypothetical protein [Pseudomonas putida]
MKNSQYNQILAVLWLIAAGLQNNENFELGCVALFTIHSAISAFQFFAERKGVKP